MFDRFRLHAGPYRPPRFRVGGTLDDRLRGSKRIVGITNALIPWPQFYNARKRALIVCGDLVHALHVESVQAVAHHWGIHPETVRRLRRALGVIVRNAGTRWLSRQYGRRLNERR